MSSYYNGVAGNETAASTKNVSSSTNATPIEITTTAAHGFTDGDRVEIVSHSTNTNANGIWTIVIVSSTKFTLTGSTGNGVGGATGTCKLLNLLPTFQLPSDGDDRNAASVNVALEDAADRAAWLSERVGNYRLHQLWRSQMNNDAAFAFWSKDTASNAGYTRIAGAGGGVAADAFSGGTGYPDIINNDWVEINFNCTVDTASGAGHGKTAIAIGYELFDYGGAVGPTPVKVNGSGMLVLDNIAGVPVTLTQQFKFTGLTRGQRLQVYALAVGFAGGATAFWLIGDACWTVKVFRTN